MFQPNSGAAASGAASAPTAFPSLFSSLGTTSAAQPAAPAATTSSTGGLLGASLLGGLGNGSSAPKPLFASATPAVPSIGLNLPSTNPQPQQAQPFQQSGLGNSLFTNTANPGLLNQQSGQQPGLSASQTRDPAYFNSLLERHKKRARSGPTDPNGRVGQVPALSMDLGDLVRRAQGIGRAGVAPGGFNGVDSRAHYLLAASGVVPGKATRDFDKIERNGGVAATYQPPEPFDPDNEKYLQRLQERGREAMIQEAIDRVKRDFDEHLEETLSINFEEQKTRIMQHFGLIPADHGGQAGGAQGNDSNGQGGFGRSSARKSAFNKTGKASTATRSVFGRSGLDKSLIGTPAAGASTSTFFRDSSMGKDGNAGSIRNPSGGRLMREKERLFWEQIQSLNDCRIQEKAYPVLLRFGQAESETLGESPRQMVDAYQALIDMTGENHEVQPWSQRGVIRERQHRAAYLDENHNSAQSLQLRKRILNGARSSLEESMFLDIESIIEKSPKEAQLGGRPTSINKIRAYIRVRAARKDLAPDGTFLQQIGEQGDYCWVLIFYLLRCGLIEDAAHYVSRDPAFQSTDRKFQTYLGQYNSNPDRRLNRKQQDMISAEYNQRLRNAPEHTLDPYRMACYKIIGRCDLSKRNLDTIGQGVDDWIWLQFSLARETERAEEISGEIFGLAQIQEIVEEIGQKHFQQGQGDTSGGYGIFFFMQILAGMFESAVAYLHIHNPVSAVHYAIALSYYGLLRVSDYSVAGDELLTKTTTDLPQINLVPLLAYYTASFRTALPVPAVDYLVLICLNADLDGDLGEVHTNGCHECLRQLCLETREFAQLLGDIRTDGVRIPGAIEKQSKLIKLDTHSDFLRAVTVQAAAIADERSQIADAVLLYHLCEDYDNVIRVINSALADAITLDLGEAPMELQPLRPRQDQQRPDGAPGPDLDVNSSLSLTQTTHSPYDLATNMTGLYGSNALFTSKISALNITTCAKLLKLLETRAMLEGNPPQLDEAIRELSGTELLPLNANGSVPLIRAKAQAFNSLSPLLARCAGIAVVWAVSAIGAERQRLVNEGGVWDGAGNDDVGKENHKEHLAVMAKDLMVFAGMVRYKMPGRVYDMLTRAGGDIGGQ